MIDVVESLGFPNIPPASMAENDRPSRRQVIILANRQPYSHECDCGGRVTLRHCSSGVVNAVEPLLAAFSGVWVAHGSGSGDRDASPDRDGLDVGRNGATYRLRRVWLSEDEERGYYDGFANEAVWPLCHTVFAQPVFRPGDFDVYQTVNARFADTVANEAHGDDPLVLVQDYHFALAPSMIRQQLPLSTIATFWHIPWPHWQTFAICPQSRELIEGLLGSDIVGFQTTIDCQNFIETAQQVLGADVDRVRSTVSYNGRLVSICHYPASIEWPGAWASGAPVEVCRQAVRRELRLDDGAILGVGIDRLDYTKGIEEKFLMIEQLLESRPELRGRFVFVQLAQPTRRRLASYRKARGRVLQTLERINRRFSTEEYRPIFLLEAHHAPASIARYFRAADVCVVSSLHDGMNLVSKEFVAARDDERGALLLSTFAGAACELTDALLFNPYDARGGAAALAAAVTMTAAEQRRRMRRMREVVARNDAHRWAARLVGDALMTRGMPAAVHSAGARRAFSRGPRHA